MHYTQWKAEVEGKSIRMVAIHMDIWEVIGVNSSWSQFVKEWKGRTGRESVRTFFA